MVSNDIKDGKLQSFATVVKGFMGKNISLLQREDEAVCILVPRHSHTRL